MAHALETMPPMKLKGEVQEGSKPFDAMEEIQKMGGLAKLVPQKHGHSSIKQHLDQKLEKEFNCIINVCYGSFYNFAAMGCFCNKDDVALPGLARYFKRRALEVWDCAEKASSFLCRRGGALNLREIAAVPSDYYNKEAGEAVFMVETALALDKILYEKYLQLVKAIQETGDMGAMNYVQSNFIQPQIEACARGGLYVTQVRRMSAEATGIYLWDLAMLTSTDAGEMTFGQVADKDMAEMTALWTMNHSPNGLARKRPRVIPQRLAGMDV